MWSPIRPRSARARTGSPLPAASLATDTDVLNPTAGNQITMLTCIANEPAYRFCVIGQEMR